MMTPLRILFILLLLSFLGLGYFFYPQIDESYTTVEELRSDPELYRFPDHLTNDALLNPIDRKKEIKAIEKSVDMTSDEISDILSLPDQISKGSDSQTDQVPIDPMNPFER